MRAGIDAPRRSADSVPRGLGLKRFGIEQGKHLAKTAIGLRRDESSRASGRLAREFRSDEAGGGAGVGEQREIFRIVEERQISSHRGVERPDILDLGVKIDVAGESCTRGLHQGAQGKWARTLKKARMVHRVFTAGGRWLQQ